MGALGMSNFRACLFVGFCYRPRVRVTCVLWFEWGGRLHDGNLRENMVIALNPHGYSHPLSLSRPLYFVSYA